MRGAGEDWGRALRPVRLVCRSSVCVYTCVCGCALEGCVAALSDAEGGVRLALPQQIKGGGERGALYTWSPKKNPQGGVCVGCKGGCGCGWPWLEGEGGRHATRAVRPVSTGRSFCVVVGVAGSER